MIVELAGGRIDVRRRLVVSGGDTVALREKEAAVLAELLIVPGEVVSREHLEQQVFGQSAKVQSRTVDSTVRRMRKALDAIDARELVQTVYGEGYRWSGPPPGRRSRVGIRGRTAVLEAAVDWLEGTGSLLVVSGPGGMGKTLLARELAARAPTCWVELVDVADAEAAVLRIADALGAPPDAIGPRLSLDGTVLVMDDCDVLEPSMGAHVARWSVAGARVVVTRRRPLPWPGAQTLKLDALSVDDARALWVAYDGEPEAAEAIWDRTCGHPLSILLASRLARGLAPDRLLALPELEARLTDPEQLHPRHRSLQSLYTSTIEQLPERSVWLLGLLALPREPLSPEWLEWLAVHHPGVLEDLANLRDAGLLTEHGACGGTLRLHGIYRAFASAEVDSPTRREHLEVWVAWVTHLATRWLADRRTPPSPSTLQRGFDAALEIEQYDAAGLLLFTLAKRAEVSARPQAPQRLSLERLEHTSSSQHWVALTRALLAASEHPPDPSLGSAAVAAAAHTPWVPEAHLLRARLRAYAGDAAGVGQDVESAENAAAARGEAAVARTWLDAVEVLSYVDIDAARRRVERAESLLHLLEPDDRRRWHRAAAVVYGQVFETHRHLEVTRSAIALCEGADPAATAAAWSQLGSARWNVGDATGALEAIRNAMPLSLAARPWIRVMCCNNLCALRQEMLDWSGMRSAMATGLARAGEDARARELARRLEASTLRYLGAVPEELVPGALGSQLGTTDTGWFLWEAQCGRIERAIDAAEAALLPLDRAPLRATRTRQLLDLGTLHLAGRRFESAARVLDAALDVLPDVSPFRVPAEAARAVARSLAGDADAVRWDRGQRGSSPLQELEAGIWRCVLHRDRRALEALRRDTRPPRGGELDWRFDVAAALLG